MTTLVQLIRQQDDLVKSVFTEQFQTADGWTRYLTDAFWASGQPVTDLLNAGGMQVRDFQALYVACWIFQPVEKGSYMIDLSPSQRANAKRGYKELSPRWSSHLHEHGRSAGKNWSFLQGYDELLVQLEGGGKRDKKSFPPTLFLKCEGHGAFSRAHLASYINKLKTGQGKTASQALNEAGKSGAIDGLKPRAAENYSKAYAKVLQALGLKGITQSIRAVASAMWSYLDNKGQGQRLASLARQCGFRSDFQIAQLEAKKLAKCLEGVLLPTVDGLDRDPLRGLVQDAKSDFDTIIENLKQDAWDSERFFAEVKVTPRQLDQALVDFMAQLKQPQRRMYSETSV
ncbi:hypothetical protein [Polyangium sp. 6x1]|uniref:hypothetical protein n=1 Tax=Polyangium sp. 6x1 TaxID=3042689 RepID=UPI0024826430|nr:hypothetical protein [Polyangium sp. 6x1]MDI1443848.1 hypothetical protein [Polyangium sp. 6x1]